MSVRRQLDLAVLDVLGVDEQDVVEDPELLQQGGADEAVEVAAGDEPPSAGDRQCRVAGHVFSIGVSPARLNPGR